MRTKISNTMDFKLCTNLCRGQHPVSVTDPVSSENKFIEFLFSVAFFEETSCIYSRNGTEGFVNRTDIDEAIVDMAVLHSLNLDCLWTVEVDPGWKVSELSFYLINPYKI